eukprot:scaffold73488_cov35-Tisochrysis_lutea.AAC.1
MSQQPGFHAQAQDQSTAAKAPYTYCDPATRDTRGQGTTHGTRKRPRTTAPPSKPQALSKNSKTTTTQRHGASQRRKGKGALGSPIPGRPSRTIRNRSTWGLTTHPLPLGPMQATPQEGDDQEDDNEYQPDFSLIIMTFA